VQSGEDFSAGERPQETEGEIQRDRREKKEKQPIGGITSVPHSGEQQQGNQD
jgi:hypothetical protein